MRSVGHGAWFAVLLSMSIGGCGGAQEPSERDIWYTASLRPGKVPPETQGERELLARMSEVPSGEQVAIGGQVFVVDEAYTAASGRLCRSVTVRPAAGDDGVEVKLACEEDAGWVFVPDVFDGGSQLAEVEAQP